MLIAIALTMKESYVPLLLSQKAKKIRFETKNWAVRSKMDEQPFSFKRIVTVYAARPIKVRLSAQSLSPCMPNCCLTDAGLGNHVAPLDDLHFFGLRYPVSALQLCTN